MWCLNQEEKKIGVKNKKRVYNHDCANPKFWFLNQEERGLTYEGVSPKSKLQASLNRRRMKKEPYGW